MTEYDVFMHYYNDDIGKAVTNKVKTKWISGITTVNEYTKGKEVSNNYVDLEYISSNNLYQEKFNREEECLENIYISKNATPNAKENTEKYEELVISSININNPKYDMIFVWDGLGIYESKQNDNTANQLYYDKMKRLQSQPWFFHSKYHSLKAAIEKANQLIDLFGKEHIMIGKEVDLTQYIEVV